MSMMKGGTHIIKVINMGVQQHYRGECTALSIASEISGSVQLMLSLSVELVLTMTVRLIFATVKPSTRKAVAT